MKLRILRSAFNSVAMKLFVTQIIVAIAALIVNVFSARILGPEARGELALFMQIAYVANAISVLGRHRAYLKLEHNDRVSLGTSHKDIRALSRSPLVISVVAATTAAGITGDGVLASFILAVGFLTLVYSGVQQKTFRSAAIVARNATPYFVGTISGQLILLISVCFLALFNISNVSIWLIVYGASVILPYFVVSLVIKRRRHSFQSEAWRLDEVKRLGIKLMPLSVAEVVGARVDRFLIPALANFAQLGIYTVVVTMTELIAWPIKNYTDAKVPQWARELSDRRFNLLKESILLSIAIVVLSLTVGTVLGWILIPLFGQDFAPGVELVWPLVLAAALHAWVHFGANLSLAAGFTGLANTIPVAAMIASTISYFIFIPILGAVGAAWGLVCGYLVGILFSLIGFVRILEHGR